MEFYHRYDPYTCGYGYYGKIVFRLNYIICTRLQILEKIPDILPCSVRSFVGIIDVTMIDVVIVFTPDGRCICKTIGVFDTDSS